MHIGSYRGRAQVLRRGAPARLRWKAAPQVWATLVLGVSSFQCSVDERDVGIATGGGGTSGTGGGSGAGEQGGSGADEAGGASGSGGSDGGSSGTLAVVPDAGVTGPPGAATLDTLVPATTGFRVDGAGTFASGGGDFNGDGLPDLIVNERYLPIPAQPARAFVIFGSTSPRDIDVEDLPDDVDGVVIAASSSALASVSGAALFAGDVNDDGRDDILVASQNVVAPITVVFGTDVPGRIDLDQVGGAAANGFVIDATGSSQWPSNRAAPAGDLNGDGRGDVLVGAPISNAACVVYGKADGAPVAVADLQQGTGGYCYAPPPDAALLGISVDTLGDVNGDALPDFVLGAETAEGEPAPGGRAYVAWGVAPENVPNVAPGVLLTDNGFGVVGAGYRVASAGDLNADGFPDLLAANAAGSSPISVYAIFGKANATPIDTSDLDAELGGGFVVRGGPTRTIRNDSTTYSITSVGDVSGDGRSDFIFGDALAGAAAAYVVFGKATGTAVQAPDLPDNPELGFTVPGLQAGDETGAGVASIGDFNADGAGDYVVTSAGSETAYVIYSTTRFLPP